MARKHFTLEDFALNAEHKNLESQTVDGVIFTIPKEVIEAQMKEDAKAATDIQIRVASAMLGESANKIGDDGELLDELAFPDFDLKRDGITSNASLMIAMVENLSPQLIISLAVESMLEKASGLANHINQRNMMSKMGGAEDGNIGAMLAQMFGAMGDAIEEGEEGIVEEGTAEDVSEIKA